MIQLTKRLVMTADKHCYTVGESRQRAGRPTKPPGQVRIPPGTRKEKNHDLHGWNLVLQGTCLSHAQSGAAGGVAGKGA